MSDLISRKALIMNLVDWQMGDFADARHEYEYVILDKVIKGIEEFPTVEAKEVVHGKWILGDVKPGYFTPGGNRPWICSECGKVVSWWLDKPTENFCSNCGADMRGEKRE